MVLDRVYFSKGTQKWGYTGIEIEAIEEGNEDNLLILSGILKVKLGKNIQVQGISRYELVLERIGILAR